MHSKLKQQIAITIMSDLIKAQVGSGEMSLFQRIKGWFTGRGIKSYGYAMNSVADSATASAEIMVKKMQKKGWIE